MDRHSYPPCYWKSYANSTITQASDGLVTFHTTSNIGATTDINTLRTYLQNINLVTSTGLQVAQNNVYGLKYHIEKWQCSQVIKNTSTTTAALTIYWCRPKFASAAYNAANAVTIATDMTGYQNALGLVSVTPPTWQSDPTWDPNQSIGFREAYTITKRRKVVLEPGQQTVIKLRMRPTTISYDWAINLAQSYDPRYYSFLLIKLNGEIAAIPTTSTATLCRAALALTSVFDIRARVSTLYGPTMAISTGFPTGSNAQLVNKYTGTIQAPVDEQ